MCSTACSGPVVLGGVRLADQTGAAGMAVPLAVAHALDVARLVLQQKHSVKLIQQLLFPL